MYSVYYLGQISVNVSFPSRCKYPPLSHISAGSSLKEKKKRDGCKLRIHMK